MNLYAESSAVLAWLLGEPAADTVREILAGADIVFASELTLVECDRVLHRGVALGEISEGRAAERRAHLATASSGWNRMRLDDEILSRARKPFPVEPIRTLDALHVASALSARALVPEDVVVVTLDDRVRECLSALGVPYLPKSPPSSQ